MPAPRIFVSSTCYDLQEIRGNIRKYIEDFGYEPIMSDFGDIFYDFDKNVQDSCIESIKNSDMYILIIGDYYGSTYHKDKMDTAIPNSVTLKEFENATNLNKPRMIFINKFVEYDYRNYRRFLEEQYSKYFSSSDLQDENIEKKKEDIKKDLDRSYPFPKKSYQYIFHFLDKIDDLQTGNAYYKFENSYEIKNDLRKQWAGYLQESLKNKEQIKHSSKLQVDKIFNRLKGIENILLILANGTKKTETNEISIDVDKIINFVNVDKLEKIQEHFDETVFNILFEVDYYDEDGNCYNRQRVEFNDNITSSQIEDWLNGLDLILKKYKWSKHILSNNLFDKFRCTYFESVFNIKYKFVLQLNSLYKSIKDNTEDKESFIETIRSKFAEYVRIPRPIHNPYPTTSTIDDDLPF